MDKLSGYKRRDKVWKDANSNFSEVFTAVVVVVADFSVLVAIMTEILIGE